MPQVTLSNYRAALFAVAALLASCSTPGATSSGNVPATGNNTFPNASIFSGTSSLHSSSPDAEAGDLVYVAQADLGVNMYKFPNIKKSLGSLPVFADGLCSDASGNVWVSVQSVSHPQVVKYKHGKFKQIASITEGLTNPWGCAVDRTTGNLAVMNQPTQSQSGYVAVYAGGSGSPQIYKDANITGYYYCAYDTQGNLVIQGDTAGSRTLVKYAELSKGSQTLEDISLSPFEQPGGIYWDGEAFALSYYESNVISRYSFANGQATLLGQTQLAFKGNVGIQQFALQGSFVVAVTGSEPNERIATYPYPSGKPIEHHHLIRLGAYALTVSVDPKHR